MLTAFIDFVDKDLLRSISLERETNATRRMGLLWISILVNLGFLGFFKYYNFFLDTFIASFSFFGMEIKANSLNIILPVGISFYTFQTLSYSIDVYRRKMHSTKDFIAFLISSKSEIKKFNIYNLELSIELVIFIL